MIDDDARNPIAIDLDGEIILPLHPNHPNKGVRTISLNSPTVYIESDDADGLYRLKEFADVEANGILGSIERSDKRPIIHWVPNDIERSNIDYSIKKKCNTFPDELNQITIQSERSFNSNASAMQSSQEMAIS